MKERLIYIDILRVLATVFVIGVHTVSLAITMVEYGGTAYYVLEIFNFIFLSCNLLFVMISGALLLPVRNERTGDFFRKRFTKVVIPMVVYYILTSAPKKVSSGFTRTTGFPCCAGFSPDPRGSAAFLAGLCDYLAVCAHPAAALYNGKYSGQCAFRAYGGYLSCLRP